MAIIKIKNIKTNLDKVINYVKNGEKTEKGVLVSSVNCINDLAYMQMIKVKKAFNKENGILAYHIIQSFQGDEVTPNQANEIGVQLAQEMFGDKYQSIVCTHTNKENVHNHIVVNSVNMLDGKKYYNSNEQIALLKETSDSICKSYNLSIVETGKAIKEKEIRNNRINYYNRSNEKILLMKDDIDRAILNSNNYLDFKIELQAKGYYLKDKGAYFTIKSPYFNRNIRLERAFDDSYSYLGIKNRIKQRNNSFKIYSYKKYKGPKIDNIRLKCSPLYSWFVALLYLIGELPPKIHYIKINGNNYRKEKHSPQYYRDLKKADLLFEEMRYVCTLHLNNFEDLKEYNKNTKKYVLLLKSTREDLWKKYNKTINNVDKETNISYNK